MADPKSKSPRARAKKAPRGKLGRVLIVEDDPVLSLALDDALRDAGATDVVTCPSIACTMDALEEGDASAVIIDVHLADRDDGWALAELIEQLGPKRPQIVFSTGTPEDIPPEIAEMGVVFAKPYNPADLAQAIAGGDQRGLLSRLRKAIP